MVKTSAEYYQTRDKEKRNTWYREDRKKNPEKYRVRARNLYAKKPELKKQILTRTQRYYFNAKKKVYDHYGQICVCCGETNMIFLTVDHVNNDGAEHRKTVRSSHLYSWLVARGFPDGFQILCMNCNWGRARNGGICPHQS